MSTSLVILRTIVLVIFCLSLVNLCLVWVRPSPLWLDLSLQKVNDLVLTSSFATLNVWNLLWMIHVKLTSP